MGGGSSTVSRTEIENEITVYIDQQNNIISNVLNQTITDLASEFISDQVMSSNISCRGSNFVNLEFAGGMTFSGNSGININQVVSAQCIVSYIGELKNSSEMLLKMQNESMSKISASLENNASAKAALDTITEIERIKKDAGGLASMVNKVADVIGSIVGVKTKQETITIVKNRLNFNIRNINTSKTDIKNIIDTKVSNVIKSFQEQKCDAITEGGNTFTMKGTGPLEMTDNAVININQVATVNGFAECLLGAINTTSIATDIANSLRNDLDNVLKNAANVGGKIKADTKVKEEEILEDGFGKMLNDILKNLNPFNTLKELILYLGLGIGGIIVLIVIIKVIGSMGKGKSSNSGYEGYDDYE